VTDISTAALAGVIDDAAHPLTGAGTDIDPIMEMVGDARLVLIGEASHGTHEFYRTRAQITQRLIAEKGFAAVAAEADFPDAYRVNCYVRGIGDDTTAEQALGDFVRFPTWMWRNADVLNFVGWLRDFNDTHARQRPKAGFYGLDLYSLYTSLDAVIRYLDEVDPEAAKQARYRYSCFDHYGEDAQVYGYAAAIGANESCEKGALEQLLELQRKASDYIGKDGRIAEDAYFYAEQNARLAKNAEQYYRSMYHGRVSTWNLRDSHMMETLDALLEHLSKQNNEQAKVIVWAHNSHLGDARATQMGRSGELNLGQLVRQKYGNEACLIGFTTYTGTVTAASGWGGKPERKRVRPALEDSYEDLFCEVEAPDFILNLHEDESVAECLREPRLERAIGVIYRPETERISHYFQARLSDQFDAVIHFDETRAVEPLERSSGWEQSEIPDTFPTGM
jgi:erythromycin esterase-like protein